MFTDGLTLALSTYPGLTTKGAPLEDEFDTNNILIYRDFLAKALAGGAPAYGPLNGYSDPEAVTYEGRTWLFIKGEPTVGVEPGTDPEYWLEIDPTLLVHQKNRDSKLAEGLPEEVSAADIRAALPQYAEVEVSSAQLLDLGSTNVLLLASPGEGNYYEISKVILEMSGGSIPYTFAADYLFLDLRNPKLISPSLVTAGARETRITIVKDFDVSGIDIGLARTFSAYQELESPLILGTYLGTNPLLGDGTMLVKIWYFVREAGTEL